MRDVALITILSGLLACQAKAALVTWVAPQPGVPVLVSGAGLPAGLQMTVTDSSPSAGYTPAIGTGTGMTSGTHTWAGGSPAYEKNDGGLANLVDGILSVSFNMNIQSSSFVMAFEGFSSDQNADPIITISASGTSSPEVEGLDFSIIPGYLDTVVEDGEFSASTSGLDRTLSSDNSGGVTTNHSLLADISGHFHMMDMLSIATDGLNNDDDHFVRVGFFGAVTTSSVPEPSAFLFLCVVATGIWGVGWRRRTARSQVAQ